MSTGNLELLEQKGRAEENLWALKEEVTSIERIRFQLEEQA